MEVNYVCSLQGAYFGETLETIYTLLRRQVNSRLDIVGRIPEHPISRTTPSMVSIHCRYEYPGGLGHRFVPAPGDSGQLRLRGPRHVLCCGVSQRTVLQLVLLGRGMMTLCGQKVECSGDHTTLRSELLWRCSVWMLMEDPRSSAVMCDSQAPKSCQ